MRRAEHRPAFLDSETTLSGLFRSQRVDIAAGNAEQTFGGQDTACRVPPPERFSEHRRVPLGIFISHTMPWRPALRPYDCSRYIE